MPYKTLEDRRAAYKKNRKKIRAQNKAWSERNRDKCRAQSARYYAENKEKALAQMKSYRERNKEKISAKKKEYREANKETINVRVREWQLANKDKLKIHRTTWRKANKDKTNVITANRRALKFRATIRLTELDKFVIDEMYNLAQLRTEQTGFQWHVDHIVPLTKGGLHKPTNLQVVPGSWNESKGNRNCEVYNRIAQNGY